MILRLFGSALVLILCVSTDSLAGITTLDPDGGIRLDGKRWFPVGIYSTPQDATDFEKDRAAGFNLVRAEGTPEYLDRVQQYGMQAWIALGGQSEIRDETEAARLKDYMVKIQNHPALAIWELPDEALWNAQYGRWSGANQEYGELKDLVSQHIRSGSEDADLLRGLFVNLARCRARNDFPALETSIKELWAALGQPNKSIATNLSGCQESEQELFENLLAGYRLLRKEDPNHLVWQNHAPRNSIDLLTKHAAYCDLIGCDIYPCPDNPSSTHSDLTDISNASVGAYTKRFVEVAPEKGTLMVLQGFGWKHLHDMGEEYEDPPKGREPKYLESRFMAYDAIVNGANGLCYWGTHYDPQGKAWESLVPVTQELIPLQEFVAAPSVTIPIEIRKNPGWASMDRDVVCSARKAGEDWLLLFVNEERDPQTVRVKFPLEFSGKRLFFLYEGQYCDVLPESELRMDFVGHGVRILSTRDNLEIAEIQNLDREIEDPF
jgi:hypothetical protein